MRLARPYDDPCGLSRALSRVGERWALLVVRELVYGPKRFADLRRGLPGVSPNVLSQRLLELEADAVVLRRHMAPPVSGWVYELTDLGADLAPAVIALARWGSRLPVQSERDLSPTAFWLALQTTYLPGRAGRGRVVIDLHDEAKLAEFDDDTLTWAAVSDSADATVTAARDELRDIVFVDRPVEQAIHDGTLHISGDRDLVVRLLNAFERPPSGCATAG